MSKSPVEGRATWRWLFPALWSLVFAVGVVNAFRNSWVCDDYYITLRYADNVLAGYGPVYNPGERCEGFTHFLWFIMLTAGRALHVDPITLGKYLGVPFYLGILALLVRISGRLFPGRGGLAGIPIAALGWALLEDAGVFAFGGLETAFFTCMLLAGFYCLCISPRPQRHLLSAWAFALATLARPEGMLFSAVALLYVFLREHRRDAVGFALLWVGLILPLFAFRLAYYGYPFPNPYYAKSGSAAYWSQGLRYAWAYFSCYFVLLLALFAAWPLAPELRLAWRRRDASSPAWPLALAFVLGAAGILYVTRLGGDYMFARFFIPVTPFLLLLCESLLLRLRSHGLRLAATAVFAALLLFGAVRKHALLALPWHGITNEPLLHSFERLHRVAGLGRALQGCLHDTQAKVLVQGGQASLAYYAHFPVAIESYGLTDVHVAHMPIHKRGRPGHEKYIDTQYIYDRGVDFRIYYRPMRSLPQFVRLGFPGPIGMIEGEILAYDRKLMDRLKSCPGIRFLDFPMWLQQSYIPNVPNERPDRLVRDFNNFKRFYFDRNPDTEGLLPKLQEALAARGIHDIPPEPIPNFEDTGQPDWSPSGRLVR